MEISEKNFLLSLEFQLRKLEKIAKDNIQFKLIVKYYEEKIFWLSTSLK